MVENWNCDCSLEVFGRSWCWSVCPVMLATTCPGHWWCCSNTATHLGDCFEPLVGWVSTFSLMFLRDDVRLSTSETAWTMSFASCWRLQVRPKREWRHSLVMIRELMNSVVVMACRRVWASVKDSGDHMLEPSAAVTMLSKQATMEECRHFREHWYCSDWTCILCKLFHVNMFIPVHLFTFSVLTCNLVFILATHTHYYMMHLQNSCIDSFFLLSFFTVFEREVHNRYIL